jgi:hypothetical protein
MPDEMQLLRDLRPMANDPSPEVARRARRALLAVVAADSRGRRRIGVRLGRRAVRRWVVPCVAVFVLGAAGVGVASTLGDWWKSADPPTRGGEVADALDFSEFGPPPTQSGRSEPDVARARTVAHAPGAELVIAPTAQGGYCVVAVPDQGKSSFVCLEHESGLYGEEFMFWLDRQGEERAWYMLGRVVQEDAARVEFFEHVSHPFEVDGAETLPGTPIAVDVGPGGFFLARIPEEAWGGLDLAFGEMTVLDGEGSVLARSCRFMGAEPNSDLARHGIYWAGLSLAGDGASPYGYPCPATGSVADAVAMTPAEPREADLSRVAGHEVPSGDRIELSSFSGRPLFLVMWDPYDQTAARILRELDAFARRHPEAGVLGVLKNLDADVPVDRTVRDLALSFPTISLDGPEGQLFSRNAREGFGPYIVVLDAQGRVAVELASQAGRDPLSVFALVMQETLEEALASATD